MFFALKMFLSIPIMFCEEQFATFAIIFNIYFLQFSQQSKEWYGFAPSSGHSMNYYRIGADISAVGCQGWRWLTSY
jgi:hypothetical protein